MSEFNKVILDDLAADDLGKITDINILSESLNIQYDVTTNGHTTDGVHSEDSLLPAARGKITFSAGTPSVAYATGTFSTSITDISPGVTQITLDTASTSTDGIRVSVGIDAGATATVVNIEVISTSAFYVRTYELSGGLGLVDRAFSFVVWVD